MKFFALFLKMSLLEWNLVELLILEDFPLITMINKYINFFSLTIINDLAVFTAKKFYVEVCGLVQKGQDASNSS